MTLVAAGCQGLFLWLLESFLRRKGGVIFRWLLARRHTPPAPSIRRPATLVCLPDAWRQEQFVVHNAELAAPGANCFVQRQAPRRQGQRSGESGSGMFQGRPMGHACAASSPAARDGGRLPLRQRAKQPEPLLFSVEKTPFGLGFVLCA